MSKEAVFEFLNELQANESLHDKLDPHGKTAEAYAVELVSLGHDLGHEFTADECLSVVVAVHEYHAKESQELGEEALEKAAGGLDLAKPASTSASAGSFSSLTSLVNSGLLGSSTVFRKK